MNISEKRLLTVEETAEILGIKPRTIYNRSAPKAVNPFPVRAKRVGRNLRFLASDVFKYIESL